jgi:succinyl-CoA synthetase beta subunit
MFLIEHEGKAILARHGIAIPRGFLIDGPRTDAAPPADRLAVKAQLAAGGRGKAGLVRVVDATQLDATVAEIQSLMRAQHAAPLVRVEEALSIGAEWYMACRVDDINQRVEWLFSPAGGVDIEQQSGSITRLQVSPTRDAYPQDFIVALRAAGVEPAALAATARVAARLCRVLVDEDAELIEINPLARLTDGRLVALDAKIIVDDSARSRHPEWQGLRSALLAAGAQTELERQASARGFQFVDMPGDIAVLTGGAGQGMLLSDMVYDLGWRPANFADSSGGGSSDTVRDLVELVFERARRDDVRGILAYFVTSATPIERVVEGLTQALLHCPPPKPLALGLFSSGAAVANMSVAQAHATMASAGFPCVSTPEEALEQLAAMLGGTPRQSGQFRAV